MYSIQDWVEQLDRLGDLQGKSASFDTLHEELSKEAARVDFVFMTLVMSGEFESAKQYITTEGRHKVEDVKE